MLINFPHAEKRRVLRYPDVPFALTVQKKTKKKTVDKNGYSVSKATKSRIQATGAW